MAVSYTEDQMVTAMCLWEVFLDLTRNNEAAAKLLGNHGSFTIRGALVHLVTACDDGWAALEALNEEAPVFDWEWCPDFVKAAFDNGLMAKALATQYCGPPMSYTEEQWKAAHP